jgi:hypothetical protein
VSNSDNLYSTLKNFIKYIIHEIGQNNLGKSKRTINKEIKDIINQAKNP